MTPILENLKPSNGWPRPLCLVQLSSTTERWMWLQTTGANTHLERKKIRHGG
jgi:hypothetical protein